MALKLAPLERLWQGSTVGNARVVAKALADGADPAEVDHKGFNALTRSAWSGSISCCELIVQAAPGLALIASPHSSKGPLTPLQAACELSLPDCALFLAPLSDPLAGHENGRSAMSVAGQHANRRDATQTLAIVDALCSSLLYRGQPLEVLNELTVLFAAQAKNPRGRDLADFDFLIQGLRRRFDVAYERVTLIAAAPSLPLHPPRGPRAFDSRAAEAGCPQSSTL